MCIISLYIIILKFVQIAWPHVHMNNLEECFYPVLTNLYILLSKEFVYNSLDYGKMVNCAAVYCHNNKSQNKDKTFFS